jgi:type III pantothenate kinase
MKRLLIDIGNTRLKWAVAEDEQRGPAHAVAHQGQFGGVLESIPRIGIRAIHVASVFNEDDNRQLAASLDARFGCAPRFARVLAERNGLRVAYAQPRRLGIDRWLMMQCLWREARSAFAVVSAGTALTVDLVDAEGQHLGGYIAPGLAAMQRAVLGSTRFEHSAAGDPAEPVPGTSTESCVRNAALCSALGLIERSTQQHPGRKLISGGDGATLLRFLDQQWKVREDLVLDALTAPDLV